MATTCTWQLIQLILLSASIKGDNVSAQVLDQLLPEINRMACDRHKLYTSIIETEAPLNPMSSSSFHQQATIPFVESMRRSELAKVIEDFITLLSDKANITLKEFIEVNQDVHLKGYYLDGISGGFSSSSCSTEEDSIVELPFFPSTWKQFDEECEKLSNVHCPISKYRTLDGTCNNLIHPTWGSANSCLLRLLPPNYGNGFNSSRLSAEGKSLPNPRLVSTSLRNKDPPSDPTINHLFMGFGQFVAHDLASAPTEFIQTKSKLQKIKCCDVKIQHDACLPLDVSNDHFYASRNITCLDFVRSAPCPTCSIGAREHSNKLSSYLDASQIYGVSDTDSKLTREFMDGRLREGNKSLLPQGLQCNPSINRKCFLAGDSRANENLPLTTIHTLFLREHNRIARLLQQLNPDWNDETLYQESRRIVAAELQVISYNEYLPFVLGADMIENFNLSLDKNVGLVHNYDFNINAGIFSVFTTNAFRFAHSTIQNNLMIGNNSNHYKIPINDVMFNSFLLQNTTGFDSILTGLLHQQQNEADEAFTADMADNMFKFTPQMTGLDLTAISILRARERGIPSYNEWRAFCSLHPFTSFHDMNGTMPTRIWRSFEKLYSHVDDVDLFAAGLAEFNLPNALVGPTFACIIGLQFSNLRRGDRFFLEVVDQPNSFTDAQVLALKKTTLARIICDNNDGTIITIQPNAFTLPDSKYEAISCSQLPIVDFSAWSAEIISESNQNELHEISCNSTTSQSNFDFIQPQIESDIPLNCSLILEMNSHACALDLHFKEFDPNNHEIIFLDRNNNNYQLRPTQGTKITIPINSTYYQVNLGIKNASSKKFKINIQQAACT